MSKASKHTKGPWHYSPDLEPMGCIETEDLERICDMQSGKHADAKIIAAAPEMLNALETIFRLRAPQFNFDFTEAPDMQLVESAIRKARGES